MTTQIVKIKTNDNKIFELTEPIYQKMSVINSMVEAMGETNSSEIPLEVDSATFGLILDYLNHHLADTPEECTCKSEEKKVPICNLHYYLDSPYETDLKKITDWDREFIGSLNTTELDNLLHTADFFGVKGLIDVCCWHYSEILKKMDNDQMKGWLRNLPKGLLEENWEDGFEWSPITTN